MGKKSNMGKGCNDIYKSMEVKKTENKKLWPDIIRIFAIYGVISLHTMGAYQPWSSAYLFKVFETSVPLFVMLSGALLLGKSESYFSFFKKRSIKVLIPWVIWTIIYMLFFYILKDKYIISNYFISGNSLATWSKFFLIQFFTGLWFLPLIFGIYLITPAIRIFIQGAKKVDIAYVLLLWFLLISLLPWILSNSLFPNWLPLFIYAPIQYSGYFILGYILIEKSGERFLKVPIWYGIPLLALFFILPISSFIEPATILGTTLIFIYLYSASNYIEKKITPKMRGLIYRISSASLGIYVVHALFVYYFNVNSIISSDSNNLNIFYTLLIFIISLIFVLVLQKIPIIKHIVP